MGLFLEPRNRSCKLAVQWGASSQRGSIRKYEVIPKRACVHRERQKAEHTTKLAKKITVAVSEGSHEFSFITYSSLSSFAYSQDGCTGTNCLRKFQIGVEEKPKN